MAAAGLDHPDRLAAQSALPSGQPVAPLPGLDAGSGGLGGAARVLTVDPVSGAAGSPRFLRHSRVPHRLVCGGAAGRAVVGLRRFLGAEVAGVALVLASGGRVGHPSVSAVPGQVISACGLAGRPWRGVLAVLGGSVRVLGCAIALAPSAPVNQVRGPDEVFRGLGAAERLANPVAVAESVGEFVGVSTEPLIVQPVLVPREPGCLIQVAAPASVLVTNLPRPPVRLTPPAGRFLAIVRRPNSSIEISPRAQASWSARASSLLRPPSISVLCRICRRASRRRAVSSASRASLSPVTAGTLNP